MAAETAELLVNRRTIQERRYAMRKVFGNSLLATMQDIQVIFKP